jgi:hypothetical protein
VALLRAQAGRDPYDRGLSDLIGEPGAPAEHSLTAGGLPMIGTSVAAAYAAGVIARSISDASQIPARASDLYSQLAATAVKFPDHDRKQHGEGLIHQPASVSEVSTAAPASPDPEK